MRHDAANPNARHDVARTETQMANVTITLYIEASEAVAVRSSVCGAVPFRFTDEQIASLTHEQHDTLIRHLDLQPGWADRLTDHAPDIGRADFETVCDLLDVRRARMMRTPINTARTLAELKGSRR